MRWEGVARRYARAFLAAVSEEERTATDRALWEAATMLTQPPMSQVLSHPGIPARTKLGVVRATLGEDSRVYRLLAVLIENRRERLLLEVAQQFHEELLRESGQVSAVVRTARPLNVAWQEKVLEHLTRRLGKNVEARFEVEQTLIGGIEVRFHDQLWDGTVKGRLTRLKRALRDEVATGEA